MKVKKILIWAVRFAALLILFYIFFIIGSMAVAGMLPEKQSEPGLLPNNTGFLILGIANTFLIIALILNSYQHGWKLALELALAYYGAVTFLTQIETWYFLSNITVDTELLTGLFIMGLPVAFIYIPLAVWILGKGANKGNPALPPTVTMPAKQWIGKLIVIAIAYVAIYWCAGYFIAWQNPELRAFYGNPGEIVPFWEHTANTLQNDPGLLPFQLFRAMLWTLCALPVILYSKANAWWTAILVGLLFTVPQNLGLILENPLIPSASVRLSHLIEGVVSNFAFGMIIAWLLHRRHRSVRDLFAYNRQ